MMMFTYMLLLIPMIFYNTVNYEKLILIVTASATMVVVTGLVSSNLEKKMITGLISIKALETRESLDIVDILCSATFVFTVVLYLTLTVGTAFTPADLLVEDLILPIVLLPNLFLVSYKGSRIVKIMRHNKGIILTEDNYENLIINKEGDCSELFARDTYFIMFMYVLAFGSVVVNLVLTIEEITYYLAISAVIIIVAIVNIFICNLVDKGTVITRVVKSFQKKSRKNYKEFKTTMILALVSSIVFVTCNEYLTERKEIICLFVLVAIPVFIATYCFLTIMDCIVISVANSED